MRRKLTALCLALTLWLCLLTPARAVRLLALTFDDGPSGEFTPQVVGELDRRGVKGTFFLVGKWLPGKLDLVRSMAEDGHQIASHTFGHADLSRLTPAEIRTEIEQNRAALEAATGQTDFLVRTPFGVRSPAVLAHIDAPVVLWSQDPAAGRQVSGDVMARRVIAGAKDGDILLLHDTTQSNLDAVGPILDGLRDRGFDFVTVDELFRLRGIEPQNGVLYKRAPAVDLQSYDEAKLSTHWAWPSIRRATETGLMTGDDSGWRPNGYLNRAMAVATLWRACGSPAPAAPAAFPDVRPGLWCADAVAWGVEQGVVQGRTADCFDCNGAVSRQQLWSMAARLLRSRAVEAPALADVSRYGDDFRIASWAREDVSYLRRLGFSSTNDVELCRPADPATRAETAELLCWLLERL